MTQETGGPAFMVAELANIKHDGMTLRDYFAIRAPTPIEDWKIQYARERGYRGEARMIAEWCYEYADEMLKARKQ
jgi:hypothetical protein